MKVSNLTKIGARELIVFDLDGTLTATKAPMDRETAVLLERLLERKKVAVIGGGKYQLFRLQLLSRLQAPADLLGRLFLFPTTATSFYRYASGWKKVYALRLSPPERKKIKAAIRAVLKEIDYRPPARVYGATIEDRGTQVTFSALGQDVVAALGTKRGVALKEKWLCENREMKMKIARILARRLPEFEVHAAGYTSIDVTGKGIDKAYGLRQITKNLGIKIQRMLFVGDAIFPGGNDYAIVRTGVDYIAVHGPEDTKRIIRALVNDEPEKDVSN